MQRDKSILWIFGGLAGIFLLLFIFIDSPLGFLDGTPDKPVPGKVYDLTLGNLAIARRSPVLVVLFMKEVDPEGVRMSRLLPALAVKLRGRAIVALAKMEGSPELASRTSVTILPAWVLYRNGTEVSRAEGPNGDLSLERLVEEQTGKLDPTTASYPN